LSGMHIVSSFSCERKGGNRLIAALGLLIFGLWLRLGFFGLAAPFMGPHQHPAIAAMRWC
jgi:hypothetical protein